MSPIVRTEHVSKWYGPRRAVSDVSFTVEPGEIVGLLGPNGSGKSTIFRILTGYLAPSAGSVEVAGYDVVTELYQIASRNQLCARGRTALRPYARRRVFAFHGEHQGTARESGE